MYMGYTSSFAYSSLTSDAKVAIKHIIQTTTADRLSTSLAVRMYFTICIIFQSERMKIYNMFNLSIRIKLNISSERLYLLED